MPVLLLKADFTVPNQLPESNCDQLLLVLPENFEISTLPLRGGCSASELEKRMARFLRPAGLKHKMVILHEPRGDILHQSRRMMPNKSL
jgi:hypothetical protein